MNRFKLTISILIINIIFVFIAALCFGADKSAPSAGKKSRAGQNASNIFPSNSQTESFVLGPEDKIKIQVWGEDELTTEMPVRPDGFISFPLIGEVKAQGRTPGQLKKEIVKRLGGYLKEPNVVVIVMEINSINVSITGEVVKPGVFKVNRPLTLLHLFSMANGFTDKAELRGSYVLRNGKKLPVNIYRLVKHDDFSQNIWLRHNDVVYIHENFKNRIHVIGEVVKPTIIFYREGMTLLDAVLLADGLTEIARPGGAKIYRKIKSKAGKSSSSTIAVDLGDVISDGDLSKNITLRPGDIIHIPRAFF
jgi:polysaccharide export outer membrane protein